MNYTADDIFDQKNISPMLIGKHLNEAFDHDDYIHEFKLDGVRCLAYLDGEKTELRNKRNIRVSKIYPELSDIYMQANGKIILDGELYANRDGKNDFSEMQRRSLMNDPMRIKLAAAALPLTFTVFDILYKDGKALINVPLMERKRLLSDCVAESARMNISPYIETRGKPLFDIAVKNNLEGIVSKRRDSVYICGKRSSDWIKIKNLHDEEFLICGYIMKKNNVVSVILGEKIGNSIKYCGHCTLGVSNRAFDLIRGMKKTASPFERLPKGNEDAVFVEPKLYCTVKYMEKTASGSMRQPVFKGIRNMDY